MSRLRVLSLFSGIGGLDLGLERAGMEIVAHSEIDPYACRVLKKHWPGVPNLGDITKVEWGESIGRVDVIAGGFPCQDISLAGKGAGINEGTRSGLWAEYARAIRHIRPRYVIVENVAALLGRGLDRVLGDLASLGYDAEWSMLSACAFGAPHPRERLFIVAYSNAEHGHEGVGPFSQPGSAEVLPGADAKNHWSDPIGSYVSANTDRAGMADGIPYWVDRVGCLGNAVVPQVAEYVGRLVVEHWKAS